MPSRASPAFATAIVLVGLVALIGNVANAVEPFKKTPARADLASEEDRLWDEAGEAGTAIRRRGLLFNEAVYVERLNQIMVELYPEFAGAIRVRILREVVPNAMAFPNGDVYISLGLLGRLENEAQIAMVLAHEGAHFVQRHGFNGRNARLVTGTLVGVIGIAGGAIGSLGALGGALGSQLILLGGAAGHGRDMEREADQIGLARMQKVGYGHVDARRAFEVLRDDAKASADTKALYLFASHPQLDERIESVASAKAQVETTRAASDGFAAMHRALQMKWLAIEHGAGRHKAMVAALEPEDRRTHLPDEAAYYLSEAYRLRGETGDEARAAEWLATAYRLTPQFPPVLRAAGLAAMRTGKSGDAKQFFGMYLQREPDAHDKAFVEAYLSQIDQERTK